MEITAKINQYRMSPRKVRLVADLMRGKNVNAALSQLAFSTKKTAPDLVRMLKSAISNAKNNFKIKNTDNLYIKKITVDEGKALRRYMPKARGKADVIKRRASHVVITLDEKEK